MDKKERTLFGDGLRSFIRLGSGVAAAWFPEWAYYILAALVVYHVSEVNRQQDSVFLDALEFLFGYVSIVIL